MLGSFFPVLCSVEKCPRSEGGDKRLGRFMSRAFSNKLPSARSLGNASLCEPYGPVAVGAKLRTNFRLRLGIDGLPGSPLATSKCGRSGRAVDLVNPLSGETLEPMEPVSSAFNPSALSRSRSVEAGGESGGSLICACAAASVSAGAIAAMHHTLSGKGLHINVWQRNA